MAERVYEVGKEEVESLSKMLSYDPYLDNTLIPPIPEQWNKEDYLEKHPELKEQAEELNKKRAEALERIKSDKDLNTIFAREQCELKEGTYYGFEDDKYYLYIKANEDFLDRADDIFKRKFKTIKRADSEKEGAVIKRLNDEESNANAGVGFLFG